MLALVDNRHDPNEVARSPCLLRVGQLSEGHRVTRSGWDCYARDMTRYKEYICGWDS